ncbi:MAG: tRNA 2-selenouridine(34) synthase MnmH [Verrucomicrobia bacterium]|nr:tRNA 2-selenouridine(34) synthase MnmH [Verrucomicrobiota bacterium]
MPDELTVDDFLARPPGVPLIDVRTPDEFAVGHLPGAMNVPLFSTAERAEIGTAYMQHGRNQAVRIGLRCVGPRLAELANSLLDLTDPAEPRLHLHCWRGGMRSASVAWLMESTFGCRVAILRGGYKSFRRWVLDSFGIPRDVRIVAGLTGSGKTEILKQLAALGECVVDLEGLAKHKGSAFGQLGEDAQPTQAQFENDLALAWRATAPERPVWLEDESRMIGKRVLPEALWDRKNDARFHVVELPLDERISHLCRGYAGFPAGQLAAGVEAIRPRLGGDRAMAAIEALHSGDFTAACRLLLTYYDRTYQTCLTLYPPDHLTRHPFPQLEPRLIATALIESTRSAP